MAFEVLAFASNDYLGLACDPAIVAAAREGASRWGAGAGASHLICGHQSPHAELETALAAFVAPGGDQRALLFSTGYLANLAILTTLADRDNDGLRRPAESCVPQRRGAARARRARALSACGRVRAGVAPAEPRARGARSSRPTPCSRWMATLRRCRRCSSSRRRTMPGWSSTMLTASACWARGAARSRISVFAASASSAWARSARLQAWPARSCARIRRSSRRSCRSRGRTCSRPRRRRCSPARSRRRFDAIANGERKRARLARSIDRLRSGAGRFAVAIAAVFHADPGARRRRQRRGDGAVGAAVGATNLRSGDPAADGAAGNREASHLAVRGAFRRGRRRARGRAARSMLTDAHVGHAPRGIGG